MQAQPLSDVFQACLEVVRGGKRLLSGPVQLRGVNLPVFLLKNLIEVIIIGIYKGSFKGLGLKV